MQIFIMLITGFLGIFFSVFGNELIPYGRGLGADGKIYAYIAKDFYNAVFVMGTGSYWFHRILPSAIIYHIFTLFQIPKEIRTIIMGFEIYNLILLLISVYVWGLIADELKVSSKGRWLGFIGLYVNFAILKWNFYYPVLTDTTAFVLAILLIYYFLKDRPWGMLAVTILGNFTWPNFAEMGLILFIFPRLKQIHFAVISKKNIILSLVISCIILVGIIYAYFVIKYDWIVPATIKTVLPLSIFFTILFIFCATKEILTHSTNMNTRKTKYLIIGISSYILIKAAIFVSSIQCGFERELEFFIRAKTFFLNLTCLGNRLPFLFGIAHIVFFGPILLLTFLFWSRFCRTTAEYGPGLSLFIFISLILSLNSESRSLFNLFPVFVIFTVKALDQLKWKSSYYIFIGFVSFLYSKIWLVINSNPAPDPNFFARSYLLLFPWQKLFMNIGYLMSNTMYIIQGSIILLTGVIFYFLFVHNLGNAS